MSSIKKALKTSKPRTVKQWYKKLDKDDRNAIEEALISGDISATGMHRILKNLDTNPIPFGVTAFKDFAREIKENK